MKRKYVKGWDWVKTERFYTPEQLKPKENPTPARSSNRDALRTVALTAGLVFGAVGLFWYHRKQVDTQPKEQVQVVYAPAPAPPPVRQLQMTPMSQYDNERLVASARWWAKHASNEPREFVMQLMWRDVWPNVEYPGETHPGDHESVLQAKGMIRFAMAAARYEYAQAQPADAETEAKVTEPSGVTATPVIVEPPQSPAVAEVIGPRAIVPAKIDALMSERPTPGRFYRVDDELAEAGIEQLATLAVASATLEVAQRKGWTAEKAMARARKLLENTLLCSNYLDLIEQSQWNVERAMPLRAGQVVWLPPIHTASLLDRRQPNACLDPPPWSDGSSRLEPPPAIWAA